MVPVRKLFQYSPVSNSASLSLCVCVCVCTHIHVCKPEHNFGGVGRWVLKRFLMEFSSHLGKKLLLPGLLDVMLLELDRTHRKMIAEFA